MKKFFLMLTLTLCAPAALAQSATYETEVDIIHCSATDCDSPLTEVTLNHEVTDPPGYLESTAKETCVCADEEGFNEGSYGAEGSPIARNSSNTFLLSGRLQRTVDCGNYVPNHAKPGQYPDVLVRRYFNSNGSMVSSEDELGRLFSSSYPSAPSLTVDSLNRLYIMLRVQGGLRIQRFVFSTGTGQYVVDTSFGPGNGGAVDLTLNMFPLYTGNDYPYSSVTNSPGHSRIFVMDPKFTGNLRKIWVVSSAGTTSNDAIFVTQLKEDGSPDVFFGDFRGMHAWSETSLGISAAGGFGRVVADMDTDGRLVLAFSADAQMVTNGLGGYSANASPLVVMRTVAANGADFDCFGSTDCLDSSFGNNGLTILGHGTDMQDGWTLHALDVAHSNNFLGGNPFALLIVEREDTAGTNTDLWVYKITGDGFRDTTFNGSGRRRLTSIFGDTDPYVPTSLQNPDIVLTQNGAVYFSMYGPSGGDLSPPVRDGFVVRLTSAGARDANFGNVAGEMYIEGIPFGMVRQEADFPGLPDTEVAIAVETEKLFIGYCGN